MDPPYMPNANKYRYLLQNQYPEVTSQTAPEQFKASDYISAEQPARTKLLGDFTV
jgi:hypothetical protein